MTGSTATVQELISHADTGGGLITFLHLPRGGEQRQHDLMGRRRRKRKLKVMKEQKKRRASNMEEGKRSIYRGRWLGGEMQRKARIDTGQETESTQPSVIY